MEGERTWSVLFIIYVIITAIEANVTCTEDDISYLCKNIANKNDFPHSLHAHIRRVTLIGTDELNGYFPNGLFNNQTWANVSELSILEFQDVEFIPRGFLDGLEHLQFLSISACSDLKYIDPDIFRYTSDLQALHLDENPFLKISNVEAALTGKLSKLKYLSLIGIQVKSEPVVLGVNFSKALNGKHLIYFDTSRSNILSAEPAIWADKLLTVRYLNVSYSSFVILGMSASTSVSKFDVELADVSGCRSLSEYRIDKLGYTKTVCLPSNLTYVFLKNVMSAGTATRLQVTFNLIQCEHNTLKLLDFSNNNIIILNVTLSAASTFHAVQILDLNSNNMEYLSPTVLNSLPSLKILDLSKNQLHNMQAMDDFVHIFSRNNDLEIIFLRSNFLSVIPANLFSANVKLRVIDLSENELTYFNSELYNMKDLNMIDLRKNRLKHLPAPFLEQVEQIFWNQGAANEQEISMTNILLTQFLDKHLLAERYKYGYNANKNVQLTEKPAIIPQYLTIKLSENPLLCDCDTFDFLQWILTTNISIVNRTTLGCKYGNNEYLLSYTSFEMIRQKCRIPVIIGTGIASSVAIIVCLSTFAIILRHRRRMARKNEDIERLKREILKNNKKFNFVVFLTYCTIDYDVVEENIRPSLNRYLKETFKTEKDLVCTGADSFVPGMLIIDEINRCIDESLVVVPVITPAFLQSYWSQEECVVAIQKHRKVVILMEQQTDISMAITTINNLIAQYTRATWFNNEGHFVIRPSWNKICQSVIDIAAETLQNYRKQNVYESNDSIQLIEERV